MSTRIEGPSAVADAVAELFPAIYRRLHSRFDVERVGVQAAAVLDHLGIAGPLTVGEAAAHLGRAQSVASEIIDGLERRGLVERMRDARDRRRTLVWLTDEGHGWRARAAEVLSRERLGAAVAAMSPRDRRSLAEGMRALVLAADAAFGAAAGADATAEGEGRGAHGPRRAGSRTPEDSKKSNAKKTRAERTRATRTGERNDR